MNKKIKKNQIFVAEAMECVRFENKQMISYGDEEIQRTYVGKNIGKRILVKINDEYLIYDPTYNVLTTVYFAPNVKNDVYINKESIKQLFNIDDTKEIDLLSLKDLQSKLNDEQCESNNTETTI
ncbi:MAG: hypothetical protein ACI4L6_03410 [Candidatus Onthoplasma sp.]